MASYQYVYVMHDLTKAFPGGREVFKGITLSFLPGVKIGVLGINGAGKSTLLKIMAGIETEFGGEAWAAEGVRVGYLAQEPHLDPDKTVAENVAEAFAPLKAAIERFNDISNRFAEPMDEEEMNILLAEQADLQEKIDHEDGWELDRRIEIARSLTSRVASAGAWRYAVCCWKSLTCCCLTSRPITSTPNPSLGWKRPCATTPAPCWWSPTTATSWRT
jgi:ATPase subunit of ABC transporter with duplicated ATPase domains